MIRAFTLFILILDVLVASDRPTRIDPSDEYQKKGVQGYRDFFRERDGGSECLLELNSLKEKYRKSMELGIRSDILHARKSMISKMKDCGKCYSEVYRVSDTSWWSSRGFCFHEDANRDKMRSALESARTALLDEKAYPQKLNPLEGFESIVNFQVIDEKSGEFPLSISEPTFHAFLAVKGIGRFATTYLIKNQISRANSSGGFEAFSIQFREMSEIPEAFYPPQVFEILPSGEKRKMIQWPIHRVQGGWYVNSEGFVNYDTSADFYGLTIPDVEVARSTIMDSVYHIFELMFPERP